MTFDSNVLEQYLLQISINFVHICLNFRNLTMPLFQLLKRGPLRQKVILLVQEIQTHSDSLAIALNFVGIALDFHWKSIEAPEAAGFLLCQCK